MWPVYSLQNLCRRTPRQEANLSKKQKEARQIYANCIEVGRFAHKLGVKVVWEWAERCRAWSLPEYLQFSEDLGMRTGVCNGCQVNENLLCKGWRMDSTWAELSKHMNLRCNGKHSKGSCLGGIYFTSFYTTEFAERVVRFISWHVQKLHDNMFTQWVFEGEEEEAVGPEEDPEDEAPPAEVPMSREERQRVMNMLRKIHSATGHCSNQHLVQNLKRQSASPAVLRMARDFSCDVCKEWSRPSPRHQATLRPIAKKWEVLQMDCGYWRHAVSGESWLFSSG